MRTNNQGDPRAWFSAYATVFLSSFCVMVVELVAGRIIARHLGASIYTWTSVIGIILGGLALGNWAGGWIADRYRARPALSVLFLSSSATCVVINVANTWVGGSTLLWDLPWPLRVAAHVALVFFLPAALLGTIGPVVGKLALSLGNSTGRTLGSVYAWGIVGSIVGTFLTGYLLVSLMGTGAIIWTVATLLAAIGVAYAPRSRTGWAWSSVVCAAFFLSSSSAAWARDLGERLVLRETRDANLIYVDESRYSHIEIRRISQDPEIRGMYLDKLLHSQVAIDDPDALFYGYVKIFAALTRHKKPFAAPLRTLTIGGGGYVFPRYLETHWPASSVEVVEIDPAVTAAAQIAFGLSRSSKIEIHHADGRVFANRAQRDADLRPYDFVYLDAVNDYSVPSQLTTAEFFRKIDNLLAGDGVLLVNFIDVVNSGLLAGALARTLGQVFEHVELYTSDDMEHATGAWRVTFVLAASQRPLDYRPAEDNPYSKFVKRLPAARLEHYEDAPGAIVLLDRFAPVEKLLAPVVRASSKELAAADALRKALDRERAGDAAGYKRYCREALRLDPMFPEAHYNLGLALYRDGQTQDAERHWLRAAAMKPDYAEAQFNLGALYYAAGDLDRAFERFGRAVTAQPRMSLAYSSLGIVAEARGDSTAARAAYDQALRLAPDSTETLGHLARLERNEKASAGVR